MSINGISVDSKEGSFSYVKDVQNIIADNTSIRESDNSTGDTSYSKDEISKAVDKLNKVLEDENTYVEYELHDKFNQITVKIINRETKEVVLEVPPKKILDLIANMCEMVGILLDKKA